MLIILEHRFICKILRRHINLAKFCITGNNRRWTRFISKVLRLPYYKVSIIRDRFVKNEDYFMFVLAFIYRYIPLLLLLW